MYVSRQHFAERLRYWFYSGDAHFKFQQHIDYLTEDFSWFYSAPLGKYQDNEFYISLDHARFLSHFNNCRKSRHYPFWTSESASIAPPTECLKAAIFVRVLLAHSNLQGQNGPNCITIMRGVTQTRSNIKSINSHAEDTAKWWACGDRCDFLLFLFSGSAIAWRSCAMRCAESVICAGYPHRSCLHI